MLSRARIEGKLQFSIQLLNLIFDLLTDLGGFEKGGRKLVGNRGTGHFAIRHQIGNY
jgi:hypothetical protein